MQSFKLSESQSGSCPNRLVAWYAWRWTAYHLVQTGRKDELRRLLLDFDYLQAKLSTTDANGLIADYDFLADEKEFRVIHPERRVLCSIGSANAEIFTAPLLRAEAPARATQQGTLRRPDVARFRLPARSFSR